MIAIRMNDRFAARWRDERFDQLLDHVVLHPRLVSLIDAPLVRANGCLVFAPLAVETTRLEEFQDRTGYEAFVNKVHIDDFLDDTDERNLLTDLFRQGVASALRLAQRLEMEGSKCRVLLSLDTDLPTATLRFFQRRPAEPWGPEEPSGFALEEVLFVDVTP